MCSIYSYMQLKRNRCGCLTQGKSFLRSQTQPPTNNIYRSDKAYPITYNARLIANDWPRFCRALCSHAILIGTPHRANAMTYYFKRFALQHTQQVFINILVCYGSHVRPASMCRYIVTPWRRALTHSSHARASISASRDLHARARAQQHNARGKQFTAAAGLRSHCLSSSSSSECESELDCCLALFVLWRVLLMCSRSIE